ncbi:ATP/GTP-binding protein [Lachnoclostridium pacaense]|uniref:AAA family ATPase n=1 Tax=Enterocloster hominis (ex Hitch et al. 2024) TaxID=1917870 RepID=UPI00102F55D1|nr:ATP/GTP-binding protein [Lachnoclostridium pacaense]MCC2819638.1 ATP/GTP-binding protein [Lachnoclostridium pacaense]
MLVRFRVGNFLSFKDVQEFSMIKGKTKNKGERIYSADYVKLLKFASVFGANASGKSNLISAIMYAQRIILDEIPKQGKYGTFKLDSGYAEKPSYFEFEIIIDGENYSYGFEIILNNHRLISEWLIKLSPDGNEDNDVKIFERDIEKSIFVTDINTFVSEKNQIRFKVYSEDIQKDDSLLFLREMNKREKSDIYQYEKSLQIINKVFLWFALNLDVNYPSRPLSDYSYFRDAGKKEEIRRVISSLGTGITDYHERTASIEQLKSELPTSLYEQLEKDISRLSDEKDSIALRVNGMYYLISVNSSKQIEVITIVFNHGNSIEFNFSEESDGTQRILDLIEILFSNGEKTYFIDEIDRSLHPCLTYRFVQEYLNRASGKPIQLIITTHESRLLDFGLLRQDEIWLANKNRNGETGLYSLDEYNVRFDKKVDKAYLEGRYGGVPIFNTIFPVEEA